MSFFSAVKWLIAGGITLVCLFPVHAQPASRHAIAMHGEAVLPPDFTHFPYTNPDAPKSGRLVQGLLGSFDSLNPFIVKGSPVQQIRGYVIESLMARSFDEPFTLYGLLAQTVETDEKRSFVAFHLNPLARFSDGRPVTAEDVLFSWTLLKEKGRPNHRSYYRKVKEAKALTPLTIRFDFIESGDRELPLILGLMPVLPKHAVDPATFEETSFTPPLGSGPYIVSEVKPGESLTLSRNLDYWGKDMPANRGLWNFDLVRLDFYRDANTHFEAFKKGLFDVRAETDPGRWETAYDFPAMRDARVIRDSFPNGLPKGMSAFVFNTRRPVFADIRVRQALTELFDFEWINANLFFGHYQRTDSYFTGSNLSSASRPADPHEKHVLAPFPDAVLPDILEGRWQPPRTDGTGRNREGLRRALALFAQADYHLKEGVLRSASGDAFSFEILVTTKDQERLALTYARSLARSGIEARIRLVDAVQFDQRKQTFDFDMIQNFWAASLSPGNEQSFYWGSQAARQNGSRNYMGAENPAIDAMIAALLAAKSREEFVSSVRALDRVLLSGYYGVPLFYLPEQWIARWAYIERPQTTSLFGYVPESWWRKQ